jgi:hypothetical protein
MKKTASTLLALSMAFGSMAFAENQAVDRGGFAPDANPNVNPPPGAVQDPGGQRPPTPTFEQWVEGGKKIPQGLVFTGGSPIFDESTGKNRSDEEVYKMCFPEIVICFPEPGTGGPDPVAEYKNQELAEYRKLEKALEGNKAEKVAEQHQAGHAIETKNIEAKLAEAKNDLVAKYKKLEEQLAANKAEEVAEQHQAGHAIETKNIEAKLAELKRPEVVICIFPPRPFPPHWGKPPLAQTKDLRPLPGDFGTGSSTLAHWVEKNIKSDQKDIMEKFRTKLAERDEGVSKEEALEEFKKDNKDLLATMKKVADDKLENRKAERAKHRLDVHPVIKAKIDAKIGKVKEVEKTMHEARKSVSDKLKEAQDELAAKIAEAKENPDKNEVEIHIKTLVAEQAAARKAALDEFRIAQKIKHEELKTAQKELREEVRNTKEDGSSRTSR